MALWEQSGGVLVVNESGVLVECPACPCFVPPCVNFEFNPLAWTDGPWNTGVDDSHVELDPGETDTHWSGSWVRPDTPQPYQTADLLQGITDAAFISPNADMSGADNRTDTLSMSFDVPAFVDHTTLIIYSSWACDNRVLDVRVNGVSTGFSFSDEGANAGRIWHLLILEGLFQAGTNTIAVDLENDDQSGAENFYGFAARFVCYNAEIL